MATSKKKKDDMVKCLQIRSLSKPDTIDNRITTYKPSTMMVDRAAPGVWAYTIGDIDSKESRAALLANQNCAEKVAQFLLAPGIAQRILTSIFPGRDDKFRAGNKLMNNYTMSMAIRKAVPENIGLLPSESVVSIVSSIMMDVLSEFKITLRSIPSVLLQHRESLFPDADVMLHAIRTSAIKDILDRSSTVMNIRDTKSFYSIAAVASNLEPIFQDIGRALLEVPRLERYVKDTLQVVRALAVGETDLIEYPAELRDMPELRDLQSNFTVLCAAMQQAPAPILTPVHKLEYAISYTAAELKKSKRFETRPIEEALSLFDHIVVTDVAGIRRAVYVHSNLKGEARSQVTHFLATDQRNALFSQAPVMEAEDVLNATTSSFFEDVSPQSISSLCATLASSIAERIPVPYIGSTMISQLGLRHYAAALSDSIQVGKDKKGIPALQYVKAVENVSVPPTVLHFGRMVASTDPGYIILLSDPSPSNTMLKTHVQTIPDDNRRMLCAMNPSDEDFAKPLGQAVEMRIMLGTEIYPLSTTLAELMNLSYDRDAYVTVAHVNRGITREAVNLFRETLSVVSSYAKLKVPNAEEIDWDHFAAMATLGFVSMFKGTFNSMAIQALASSIHYRLLQTDKAQGNAENLRTLMQHTQTRMEVQIWAGLLALNKAGWLPFEDINWMIDLFRETRIYPSLASSFNA